ncbi:hypothetical protein J6590_039297 [Homalodisca vitripennis]|nr:hypothetical protein J6590_039297 [Homalodisca vitripennis]
MRLSKIVEEQRERTRRCERESCVGLWETRDGGKDSRHGSSADSKCHVTHIQLFWRLHVQTNRSVFPVLARIPDTHLTIYFMFRDLQDNRWLPSRDNRVLQVFPECSRWLREMMTPLTRWRMAPNDVILVAKCPSLQFAKGRRRLARSLPPDCFQIYNEVFSGCGK